MEPIIDLAARLQSFGAIGEFLLFLVKATLILAVVRLLLAAAPQASAATRHLGVTLALLGILAMPFIGILIPSWSVPILPTGEPAAATGAIGVTGSEEEAPTALDAAITVARATGVVAQDRINAVSNAFQQVKNSWQGLVLLAVFAISGLLLVRMLMGMRGVARVAHTAEEVRDDESLLELDMARDALHLDREVRLLRSSRISMPVVWGFLEPVLLLPASSAEWTRERLRVVLMHELAHVRRHDGITLLLTRAAVAIFWFHPLMWTLERLGRSECERACDDLVLASGTKPSEYAEHLLSIARAIPHADPFRSVTLAMTRRSQLEGRLLSILQPNARRGSFSARMVAAFAITAVLILVPVSAMKVVAAPPPQDQKPAPDGYVDFGPSVAARIIEAPQTLLAQLDHYNSKKRGEDPKSASGWYERGMDLHHDDRYPEAIKAFERAIAERYRVSSSMYNIACGYALMGDRNKAMRWLRDAVGAGFDSADHIASDSDLDPLRSDREFQALLSGLKAAEGDHDHRGDDRLASTLEQYEEMRAGGDADSRDWAEVGLDLLRLRQLDQSIDAYQRAIATGGAKTGTAMYNLACAYSLKGDTASAADWLQRAIDNGFDNVDKMRNDPDLRNVRTNPRFAEMTRVAEDLKLRTVGWKGPEWLFGSHDEDQWRKMLPHYKAMTAKYADNGRAWFNLGYAQLQAGDNQASAESFRKAVELNYRTGASNYNAACAYAKADMHDQAFDQLNRARAAGFKLKSYLEGDDDLDNIRSDDRFRELRRQVRSEADKKDKDKHEIF